MNSIPFRLQIGKINIKISFTRLISGYAKIREKRISIS